MWMTVSEPLNWNDVQPSIQFVINNGVWIGYVKCFDELNHMKKFMENYLNDEEFTSLLACQSGTDIYETGKMVNATQNCWRFRSSLPFSLIMQAQSKVFSLMQAQWTKERNMLNVELLRWLLFLQCNFTGISCTDFHTFQKSSVQWQNHIWSTENYEGKQLENWWWTIHYVFCIQIWRIFLLNFVYSWTWS